MRSLSHNAVPHTVVPFQPQFCPPQCPPRYDAYAIPLTPSHHLGLFHPLHHSKNGGYNTVRDHG